MHCVRLPVRPVSRALETRNGQRMTTALHYGNDLQSRARAAGYAPDRLDGTVLLVGVGAAGQNTGLNLALSGVREIRLVDGDAFEPHNATRSPGFPFGAPVVDLPKAPTVARWLRQCATHPDPEIRWADVWIEDLGRGAFEGVDVVVSCVDTLRARAYLSDRCREFRLPLIEAGFGGPDINVGVYPAPSVEEQEADTACWRCGREVHDEVVSCRTAAELALRAGVIPAIQSAAATVAGLQAEATIQALHGHEHVARRVWLNIRTGESTTARLLPDADCQGTHRVLPTPMATEVDVTSPIADLLAVAKDRLEGDPAVVLPSPYIEREACAACAEVIAVGAPGHRFVRSPLCHNHGGPYPVTDESGPLSPVALVRAGDPLAGSSCESVGLAHADRVVARDGAAEIVLRLGGAVDSLFAEVEATGRTAAWLTTRAAT
jgi:molybdopterin/thiamine biosynthesis adenylyltransferase